MVPLMRAGIEIELEKKKRDVAQVGQRSLGLATARTEFSLGIIDCLLRRLDFHALSTTLLATTASYNGWDHDRLAEEWDTHRAQVLRADYNESLAATIELSRDSPTLTAPMRVTSFEPSLFSHKAWTRRTLPGFFPQFPIERTSLTNFVFFPWHTEVTASSPRWRRSGIILPHAIQNHPHSFAQRETSTSPGYRLLPILSIPSSKISMDCVGGREHRVPTWCFRLHRYQL